MTSSMPFNISQTSKCLTTLKANTKKFPSKWISFEPSIESYVLAKDYKTFFTSTDQKNCPITECMVMQKGCLKPHDTTYFNILSKKDF